MGINVVGVKSDTDQLEVPSRNIKTFPNEGVKTNMPRAIGKWTFHTFKTQSNRLNGALLLI